ARVAAVARSGGALFLVDKPRRNRSAAAIREGDICMMNRHHLYVALVVTALHMLGASALHAQQPAVAPLPPQPVVTVSASATAPLNNDRMHALLRVEVDHPDPVAAGNEVNTRMAKALARAKAVRGVESATTGYSSYQISERNQPQRWRVSQTLSLESSDFAALSALISKIQSDDGIVLS